MDELYFCGLKGKEENGGAEWLAGTTGEPQTPPADVLHSNNNFNNSQHPVTRPLDSPFIGRGYTFLPSILTISYYFLFILWNAIEFRNVNQKAKSPQPMSLVSVREGVRKLAAYLEY